jgi:hypothetical protein
MTVVTSPLLDAPTVAVTAVGRAEGARGAAAALACAGADLDRVALLVDVGGRPPRPTLLTSAAARGLEERLAAHLPESRAATRGRICQLTVPAGAEGFEAAAAAVTVARGALAVLHLPPDQLQPLLAAHAPRLSGALVCANLTEDRALTALVARDLLARGLRLAVLKRRLNWVTERRALFGVLGPDAAAAALPSAMRNLLSEQCYIQSDGQEKEPAGRVGPEQRDHARVDRP